MSLTIVSSDRPTRLIERLAADLAAAPLDPFARETIIVSSRGTERWVRHELARRLGCAASLDFPFAAFFFGELAGAGTRRADDPFARDPLTWRILDLLDAGLADEPDFEALRAFAGPPAEHDTRKLLGLARVLARRFDEYQLYRPDLLLDWELAGDDAEENEPSARWQGALWRRLCATNASDDQMARLLVETTALLEAATDCPLILPPRLSVFGVNTLPPLFVRALHAVARHIPVRVYLQAPPRRSWAQTPANPLFATFGAVARDFVQLLEQSAPAPLLWKEHHEPAGDGAATRSILAQLQADLRAGIHRGPETGLAEPIPLAADRRDESLAVHRCHSPMREMEVLRDQLLAAFAADPTLRPHDVLILVPDVGIYAPLVEAVFGVGEPGLPRIPHRIADRPVVQESRMADAALRILRLAGARWTAAELVELLDIPAIQRAAGLADGATDRILGWIHATNIRWGRDGAMRSEIFGLPALESNSWRAGIDRLLMGYATGRTDDLVADVLPCAGQTIGDPETLGAFARFVGLLFDTLAGWRAPRSLADWSSALRDAFVTLLAADGDDEEYELDALLRAVDHLATMGMDAGCARTFELPVIRDWLEQLLGDERTTSGFLAGGMTVCALAPMRVVPHRIVAIAGLDDASFPRREQRPAFDMMRIEPRTGDRDRRADDRQLFLETLLATGDRLILSCVARSARNNAARAASVVVAELLDVVDRSFVPPPAPPAPPAPGAPDLARTARRCIVVDHRLQPFSPAYFTGGGDTDVTIPRLFSYSRANARALAASWASRADGDAPFVTGALPAPAHAARALDVNLQQLIDCWCNPSKYFCTRTLGIRLSAADRTLEECEPMTVGTLDRYQVHDAMLQRHLAGGRSLERERREAIALGALPSGALTGAWFDRLERDLAEMLATLGSPRFEEPVVICVDSASWRLTGRIDGITGDGRLQARPGACRPKDQIGAWITHLALTAAHGPLTTRLVGKTDETTFGDVPAAEAMRLLDALIRGSAAALREPIPFFAQASHAWADYTHVYAQAAAGVATTRRTKSPMAAARDAYDGSEFGGWANGDRDDPYVALAWRGRAPLDDAAEQFDEWSMTFWRPAFEAMRRAKSGA